MASEPAELMQPRWTVIWKQIRGPRLELAATAIIMMVFPPRGYVPVGVHKAPEPPGSFATITGFLVARSASVSVDRRLVIATTVGTGMRIRLKTSKAGAFAFKVPAGTYVLTVQLGADEELIGQPPEIEVVDGESRHGVDLPIALHQRARSSPLPDLD